MGRLKTRGCETVIEIRRIGHIKRAITRIWQILEYRE